MSSDKLGPVKVFVDGHNSNYDVQLKINGVSVGKGSVSGLKIFNEEHPFKNQLDDMPSFVKDQLAFVLKEGENSIEIKFKIRTISNSLGETFSFALKGSMDNIPLYYFSSREHSGYVSSKFYIENKNSESKDTKPSLGNEDAAFIFSERTSYFQAVLNNNNLMYFGGAGGLTDLNLVEGENNLEVKYASSKEGDFMYYLRTPNFTKKIIKYISKEEVGKELIDVYKIEK